MEPQGASYQNKASALKAVAQNKRKYADKHVAGNLARHFLTGGEKPHLDVQQQDLADINGGQMKVEAQGPWKTFKTEEYPTGTTGDHYLWMKKLPNGKVIYNVTSNHTPPKDTEGGYYDLDALLAQKKSHMFSQSDDMFDDEDMFGEYPPDGGMDERNTMKYKNINPLTEIEERPAPIHKLSDLSFMDDIFFNGGATSVDLGPQTQFNYSLSPRTSGPKELDVTGILGEEPVKKSVWESVDAGKLIEAGVKKGLNRAQLKDVLKFYGFIKEANLESSKNRKGIRVTEKVYLVYGPDGNEIKDPKTGKAVLIRAAGLNAAEAIAKRKYGDRIIVSYTEI